MNVRKLVIGILAVATLSACGSYNTATVREIPEPVRQSMQAAVEHGHRAGVVVGMVNPTGRYFAVAGSLVAGGNVAIDEHSQVGIGSLTKLFTAEAFADFVVREELKLDSEVATLWPEWESEGAGQSQVRLWQLAAHRAGLPRDIPAQALERNSVKPLLDLLEQSTASRDAPAEEQYSNAGMALLALSLEKVGGKAFADILQERVTQSIGLVATSFNPDPARLAHPHQGQLDISEGRPETVAVARGAGGLYSTAEDLLVFVEHHLQPENDLEAKRLALLTGQAESSVQGMPLGAPLGWKLHVQDGVKVYHHGGDGNGYQGFVGFRPDNGVGVVLLSNSSSDDALQDIALHLLFPEIPLPDFDHPPAILLPTDELQAYVGVYRYDDEDGNTVRIEIDNGLPVYAEFTPAGELVRRERMYASEPDKFDLRQVPVSLEFKREDGEVTHAVVTIPGESFKLNRQ